MPRFTFENKFTISGIIQIGLLLLAAAGTYWGIVGRVDGNDKDIAVLQKAVAPIPAIQADLQVIQNTIATGRINRDKQFNDLASRVDQNQSAVDTKLDKIVDGMTQLSNQLASLTATLRAQEARR